MWFVGVAFGCGYLGVVLISHIVRNVKICPGSAPELKGLGTAAVK